MFAFVHAYHCYWVYCYAFIDFAAFNGVLNLLSFFNSCSVTCIVNGIRRLCCGFISVLKVAPEKVIALGLLHVS